MDVEFYKCRILLVQLFLTDLQSTHSKSLVYDTLQRCTDITELSTPAALALVVHIHEEKITHVSEAAALVDSSPGSLQSLLA